MSLSCHLSASRAVGKQGKLALQPVEPVREKGLALDLRVQFRRPHGCRRAVAQPAKGAEIETTGGDDEQGRPCRQSCKEGSAEKSQNGRNPHGLWFRKRPAMPVTLAWSGVAGPLIALAA